jgi:transcription elongation GreA/GreB family factor
MDSPLGRALLGKRLDDEVKVEVPTGTKMYVVVEVVYEGADEVG